MDLFSQLIQGVTPEKNEESDEFLTTEAVFAETIPYMKTYPRIFNLPKGSPMGRGHLCYCNPRQRIYRSTCKCQGNSNLRQSRRDSRRNYLQR